MSNTELTLVLVTLLVGAATPFFTEWLNIQFQANEKKALVLAGVASAVLAVFVLLITGQLKPSDFGDLFNGQATDAFAHVFFAVYTVGNIVFNLFKKQLGWDVKR